MSEVLLVDIVLLLLVTLTAIAVIRTRSLYAAVMLSGIYSLLMALVWSNMHALDVAFTEASVGAGISTILLLGALVWTGRESKANSLDLRALAICLATGAILIYGTFDMPRLGDASAPIHTVRVPKMLAQRVGKLPQAPVQTYDESESSQQDHGHDHAPRPTRPGSHHHVRDDFGGHVTNTVTSLLASYRGYDTMFETAVIFTAGISLALLLRRMRPPEDSMVQPLNDSQSNPTKSQYE